MGGIFSRSSKGGRAEELETALSKAKNIVSSTPVVIFSKTYCQYCNRVKQLLSQLGAAYKAIELDNESDCRHGNHPTATDEHLYRLVRDGGEIQSALAEWTGQRTVPNVFIAGKHIGGCDDVLTKHKEGKLVALLSDAGAIADNSSQL